MTPTTALLLLALSLWSAIFIVEGYKKIRAFLKWLWRKVRSFKRVDSSPTHKRVMKLLRKTDRRFNPFGISPVDYMEIEG